MTRQVTATLRYSQLHSVELKKLKVILCAPTGKAALNNCDMTFSLAFCIPISQFNGLLDAEMRKTY
ncbi:hypothetical protein TYRP_022597 [Tyrophagus putrescentiae]|nr:hypothetical protein TYRP_022587 [Tyrophagus putrescentiae]KAH9391749.1 hypothetical protein TYRP_022597 [Tyrophagus putrescentiae]